MNREALRLYLVTNRYQDSVESFLEKVETACRSGVTIVQLREKNLTTNQYYQLAKQVKEITDAYQVPLIIDDRLISVLQSMQQVCISEMMNYQFRLPDKSWALTKSSVSPLKRLKELWKRRNQVQITWVQEPFSQLPPRKMRPSL